MVWILKWREGVSWEPALISLCVSTGYNVTCWPPSSSATTPSLLWWIGCTLKLESKKKPDLHLTASLGGIQYPVNNPHASCMIHPLSASRSWLGVHLSHGWFHDEASMVTNQVCLLHWHWLSHDRELQEQLPEQILEGYPNSLFTWANVDEPQCKSTEGIWCKRVEWALCGADHLVSQSPRWSRNGLAGGKYLQSRFLGTSVWKRRLLHHTTLQINL